MDEFFDNQNKESSTPDASDNTASSSAASDSAVSAPEMGSPVIPDNAGYTPQFSYAAPTNGFDSGFAPQKKSKAPAIILAVIGVIILAAAAVAILNLNLIKAKINPEAYLLSGIEKTATTCAANLEDTPFAALSANDKASDITSDIKVNAKIEDIFDMSISMLTQYDVESNSSYGDVSLTLNGSDCGFETYLADDYITFGLDGLSGKYYGLPAEKAASKLNEVFELGLSEEEISEYDEMLEKSLESVDEALEKKENPYEKDFVKFVQTTYNSCSAIVRPQVGYAAYPFDANGNVVSDVSGKKDNIRIRYDMTGADIKEMWSIIRTGLETDPAAKNYLMENAEFIAFLENMNYDGSEDLYEDIFIGYVLSEIDYSLDSLDDNSTLYADFFTDKSGCISGMIIGSDDNGSSVGITASFGSNVKSSDSFNVMLVEDGSALVSLNCGKSDAGCTAYFSADNGSTTLDFDWNKDNGAYTLGIASDDEFGVMNMVIGGILTSTKEATSFTIDSMTIDDNEDVDVTMSIDVKYESSFEKPSSVLDINDWSAEDVDDIKNDISESIMALAEQLY